MIDSLEVLLAQSLEISEAAVFYDYHGQFPLAIDNYKQSCLLLKSIPPDINDTNIIKLTKEILEKYENRITDLTLMVGDAAQVSSKISEQTEIENSIESITENKSLSSPFINSITENKFLLPLSFLNFVSLSISNGCFLTSTIYISKSLWKPMDIKFVGLQTKRLAFEGILESFVKYIQPIVSCNLRITDNLHNILKIFKVVMDEYLLLRNQLSKPFPYIKEILLSHSNQQSIITFDDDNGSENNSSVSKFTNIISNWGKSVRKYAEVGYQRLNNMSTPVSSDEFDRYVAVIQSFCVHTKDISDFVIALQNALSSENDITRKDILQVMLRVI